MYAYLQADRTDRTIWFSNSPLSGQIEKETGVVLVTRGRYFADKSQAGSAEKDRPLYLYLTANSREVLHVGVRKILEAIEQADGRAGVAHVLALRPTLSAALDPDYVVAVKAEARPLDPAAPPAAGGAVPPRLGPGSNVVRKGVRIAGKLPTHQLMVRSVWTVWR